MQEGGQIRAVVKEQKPGYNDVVANSEYLRA